MEREFDKPPCGTCKELKGERFDPAVCKDCMPAVFPENKDALTVYRKVYKQLIIAPSGKIVDIDHGAIHRAMDLYEIPDRKGCFEKVLKLANHFNQQDD